MPPRSLAPLAVTPAFASAARGLLRLSLAAASALAAALVSSVSAAQPPAVPPVAEIPVAPLPKPRKPPTPAPEPAPATTTTTVTTTTVVTPSLAAMTTEPLVPSPPKGATEAQPPSPADAPAVLPPLRVVIADEVPSRTTHASARELPDHEREHGHSKSERKSERHGRHGRPFHPAPGIVVDVTAAQGGASAAELQRTARNAGYWPFRHCYEEGLERSQSLAGSVRFGLVRAGGVTSTQLVESTVKDESVTLCVLREARHLDLAWGAAPGDAASDAGADMKVTLATGDEAVPTPRPALHAEELREALHASFPAIQQCYASQLERHPDLGGRMELRFEAKSDGEVIVVSEDEPRFSDVDVTRCVLGVYRTAKLPRMHGSHSSRFVYALHFEAAPAAIPASR